MLRSVSHRRYGTIAQDIERANYHKSIASNGETVSCIVNKIAKQQAINDGIALQK
jgi:hypothetical protein